MHKPQYVLLTQLTVRQNAENKLDSSLFSIPQIVSEAAGTIFVLNKTANVRKN